MTPPKPKKKHQSDESRELRKLAFAKMPEEKKQEVFRQMHEAKARKKRAKIDETSRRSVDAIPTAFETNRRKH